MQDNLTLLTSIDLHRIQATKQLNEATRADMGQFMTPSVIASYMASLFEAREENIRLLDAGAGTGSLTAAYVHEVCNRKKKPKSLSITTYEIDPILIEYLEKTLEHCKQECEQAGINCSTEIVKKDFIVAGEAMLNNSLFTEEKRLFDCAILNPPYKKINTNSQTKRLLQSMGIETTNLYTAFLAIAIKLLKPNGELVAITPRSFCNGPYFKPFRKLFFSSMTPKQFYVFDTRNRAFHDDDVLQENIIFYAIKNTTHDMPIIIASGDDPMNGDTKTHNITFEELVHKDDPEMFIHLITDTMGNWIVKRMERFKTNLDQLGINVSTGKVVDFRSKESISYEEQKNGFPLIYPTHFENGYVVWPKNVTKKPNWITMHPSSKDLLIPSETYVVVKRFSSKEEKKRIVAVIYKPERFAAKMVGFENHLNYFHEHGHGLGSYLAKGLMVYLNSTLVDSFFRQFNGHTQVNATDLRKLEYPTKEELEYLGKKAEEDFSQEKIDKLMDELITNSDNQSNNPIQAKKKIEESLSILKQIGLPREQQNERSALTLLALLNIKPETPWSEASNPLIGISKMIDYFAEFYGKAYAENTRETIRKETTHQLLDAGIIVANPDNPDRPTNSPHFAYQVEQSALELLQTFGTEEWEKNLGAYLSTRETLAHKYAQEREMQRIPVTTIDGKSFTLSPGGQNVLIKEIIQGFCPRFTPGGVVIYVGDTDVKFGTFDREYLETLGVQINNDHGKMPDVVVHFKEKNWLVLIEAVTSHGPINAKRKEELKNLFSNSSAGLVYVTAFLDRRTMNKYLTEISWETEVWVAESATHMIHFNGERFLGPY